MSKTHSIKLREEFADDVLSGVKTFEVRFNDRGYQKGDLIEFRVVNTYGEICHPLDKEVFEITYVLNGWGLEDGFVALAIRKMDGKEN